MVMFRQDETAVGEDGRQRYLDQIVVDMLDQPGDDVAEDAADDEAANRHFQEIDYALQRIERALQRQSQHDVENDHGGAVVEEALAFDKGHQPFGRAHGAEGGDDCHGVGGGDQRSENEGSRQGQDAGDHQNGGDNAGAQQYTGHGHGHDRFQVGFQIFELQVERGFEDKGRDKETQHQSRRKLQVHAAANGQDQPGANQCHRVGQSYAAHGQSHQQYDCQHLDNFKFQLEEGFHDLLQNSRGARLLRFPPVKLLVCCIQGNRNCASGDVRHTGRHGEVFDNLPVLHTGDSGKGELLPLFQHHVGQAKQVRPVEADGKAVADERQSLMRIAALPSASIPSQNRLSAAAAGSQPATGSRGLRKTSATRAV